MRQYSLPQHLHMWRSASLINTQRWPQLQHVSSGGAGRARRQPPRCPVVLAQRKAGVEERPQSTTPGSLAGPQPAAPQQAESYGFFDITKPLQPFEVPWGGKELVIGLGGFLGGSLAVVALLLGGTALAVKLGGVEVLDRLPLSKAGGFLGLEVVQAAVGLAAVWAAVRPFQPLPPDLLKIDFRRPFHKPDGWAAWGLLGVAFSPLAVNGTADLFQAIGPALGYDGVGGEGTADAVIAIATLDAPTFAAIFISTSVLAPLLEETLFRGFLLATLTKWMPVPAALLTSSLVFGAAHLTPRDLPELTALGFLMGLIYVRSRNLLAPMLVHSAANGFATVAIFALTAMGVDAKDVVHGGSGGL